jgi:hypothetical protein
VSENRFKVFLILFLLAAGAYGSVVYGYRWAADDVMVEQSLGDPHSAFNFEQQGLWRSASIPLMAIGLVGGPSLYAMALLLLHVLNGLLLFRILARLEVDQAWALACASLFVVFPGYHEGLVWISASGVVWSTTFFLLTLAVSLDDPTSAPARCFRASLLVAFTVLGNLMHEQLLLAHLALPVALIIWRPPTSWSPAVTLKAAWWRFMPWLGCALYLAGYFSTLHATTTKQPVLSLRAALSPLWHQVSNLMAFDVWTHPQWVRSFGRELLNPGGIVTALMLIAGAAALAALRLPAKTGGDPVARRKVIQAAAGWVVLIAAAAAIYALAGGYSLDSRKRYVFAALILMGTAHVLSIYGQRVSRSIRVGTAILCIAAGSTAGALTQARKEMLDAVAQFKVQFVAEAWVPPVHIDGWDDSPTSLQRHLWTDMREEMSFVPSPRYGVPALTFRRTEARTMVAYDWTNRRWTIRQ